MGPICKETMMNRALIISAMMALAFVSSEAAPKKTARTVPLKQLGTTVLNISEAECRNIHGGLILSTSCHSGGACRTTTHDPDGRPVYHDECLNVQ
jgi:hypothetical protein